MSQDFSSVLAGFVGAASKTEIKEREGGLTLPTGEYHLELMSKTSEAKTNQYGPYVQTRIGMKVLDPGDFQDREKGFTYLINTTKDGELNFGGQDFVTLAGILAGEPIKGNNPVTADAIVTDAVSRHAVIRARVFTRKNGYQGFEALSLESPIETA